MKKKLKPYTAIFPCPVVLLCSGEGSNANIMTLAWVANVSYGPPIVAAGISPQNHSYRLIKETNDFSINIPSTKQLQAVHICGTTSGKNSNKWEASGFTQMPATKIKSPLIAECQVNVECTLQQMLELGGCHLFLGEVVVVHMDEEVIGEKGKLDVGALSPFTYNPYGPGGDYWALGRKIVP